MAAFAMVVSMYGKTMRLAITSRTTPQYEHNVTFPSGRSAISTALAFACYICMLWAGSL
jgi:membrane-associated phospholipid phosphatase